MKYLSKKLDDKRTIYIRQGVKAHALYSVGIHESNTVVQKNKEGRIIKRRPLQSVQYILWTPSYDEALEVYNTYEN
jgi:hypothetical protein